MNSKQIEALEQMRRVRSGAEKRTDQHKSHVDDIYVEKTEEEAEKIIEERRRKVFVVGGSFFIVSSPSPTTSPVMNTLLCNI